MFKSNLRFKPMLEVFVFCFLHNDKQKEAWMRYFHALSVACVVGTITVIFTEHEFSWLNTVRVTSLTLGAITLLFGGLTIGRKL